MLPEGKVISKCHFYGILQTQAVAQVPVQMLVQLCMIKLTTISIQVKLIFPAPRGKYTLSLEKEYGIAGE